MSAPQRTNLNLYRVFDAVYQTGSITRAAGRLHISQPAVSHALAQLRTRYAEALFVREGRRIIPTATAHRIAVPIREALQLLEQAAAPETGFDPGNSSRRFTIGMRDVVEPFFLPPLLTRLRGQGAGLSLHSVDFDRARMARQLASGELDLVLDIAHRAPITVRSERLSRESFCIAMRKRHPLARGGLRVENWLRGEHIAVSARPSGPSMEELALQAGNLQVSFATRCQSWQAACQLVADTDLIALLPHNVASHYARLFDFRIHELPVHLPPLETRAYWHPAFAQDEALRWLRGQLLALAT